MWTLASLAVIYIALTTATYAEEAQSPDGAQLYNVNCAHCHNRNLPRMPSITDLKEKDPKDVFSAISAGVMAPYTCALSHAERRAVTEYATGQALGDFASGAAAIPQSAYCANKPAKTLGNTESGWNSWGSNLANTRFQTPERAGLSAEDVSKLKLKWAFGVPAVSTMSGHPIVADGRLFFGTFSGLIIALDADSGCALWVYEAHAGVRTALTLGKLADGTISLFLRRSERQGLRHRSGQRRRALAYRRRRSPARADHWHTRVPREPPLRADFLARRSRGRDA